MGRTLLLALALATGGIAEAGELSAAIHQMQLPSGLKVIYRRDTRFPVIHGAVGVGAGHAATPDGKGQLAHLTEHLWFRSDMGQGEMMDVIEAQACATNAYTSQHHTVYWNTCPSVAAGDMVERLATLLQGELPSLTQDHIAQEHRIIEREQQMRGDNAFKLAYDQISEFLWPVDHPLYRDLEEKQAEGISRIALSDVHAWLDTQYKPSNAVLALSGDLTSEELFELLRDHLPPEYIHPELTREHLKEFPKSEVAYADFDASEEQTTLWYEDPANPGQPLGRPAWPDQFHERDPRPMKVEPQTERPVLSAPTEHDTLMVGWTLPPANRSNYWPLQRLSYYANIAMDHAFGGNDDVESFGCMSDQGRLGSAVLCMVELREDADVDRIDERIRGMFGDDDWSEDEREWLSWAWRGDSWFNAAEVDTADADELSDVIEYILTTGSSAYQATKRKTGAATGIPRMKNFLARHMTEARAVSMLLEARSESVAAHGHEGQISASKGDLTVELPGIDGQDTLAFYADADLTEMDGGLELLTLPMDGLHRGYYDLVFPRGDDGHHGALDTMILRAYLEPHKKDTKDYLSFTYETWYRTRWHRTKDYSLTTWMTDDFIALRQLWSPSSKTASYVVRYFAPYLLHPTLKPMSKSERKRWEDDLVRSWRSVGYWGNQWIWQKMSGEDRAMGIAPEDVQAVLDLKPEVVAARWETLLNPARATLLSVGEVDDDHMKRAVKEWLWEFTEQERPDIGDVPHPAPAKTWGTGSHLALLPSDGESSNVTVTLTCPLADSLPTDAQNAFAHRYMSATLGDTLFLKVRQERGLAYSPYATNSRMMGHPVVTLGATVAPEDAPEALQVFKDTLATLRDPVSPAHLEAGRRRHFHALQTQISSIGHAEWNTMQGASKGLDLAQLAMPAADLQAVQPEHLQAAIAPCAGNEVITLSGARTQLDAVQAELGMEADVIDWKEDFLQRIETHYPARLAKERKRLER